ncbi:Inpp5a [Columba guinea]|nr:Inpp5a [Columba guinea]
MAVKGPAAGAGVLLVTANVGSLFDDKIFSDLLKMIGTAIVQVTQSIGLFLQGCQCHCSVTKVSVWKVVCARTECGWHQWLARAVRSRAGRVLSACPERYLVFLERCVAVTYPVRYLALLERCVAVTYPERYLVLLERCVAVTYPVRYLVLLERCVAVTYPERYLVLLERCVAVTYPERYLVLLERCVAVTYPVRYLALLERCVAVTYPERYLALLERCVAVTYPVRYLALLERCVAVTYPVRYLALLERCVAVTYPVRYLALLERCVAVTYPERGFHLGLGSYRHWVTNFCTPENLQKNWLREFYQVVHAHKPHFMALHCQEFGGKNYEASMSHVDKFVKELLSSDAMKDYNRARVYLDENYKSQEHFTCESDAQVDVTARVQSCLSDAAEVPVWSLLRLHRVPPDPRPQSEKSYNARKCERMGDVWECQKQVLVIKKRMDLEGGRRQKINNVLLSCRDLVGKQLFAVKPQDCSFCMASQNRRFHYYFDKALGSFYFLHESLKNIYQFDFKAKKYKKVTGKEIYSDTLESTPMLEKEKFPQDYFPECKWSRKGFIRTRWCITDCAFDLVNIHLFHDASNLIAWETSPSVYSGIRHKALGYVLDRIIDQRFEKVSYFVFGDFNFRLDAKAVVETLCAKATMQTVRAADTNEVVKLIFRESDNDRKVMLQLEKKLFDYFNQDVFRDNNGTAGGQPKPFSVDLHLEVSSMREPEISLVSGGRTGPISQAHKEGEDRFSFQHLLMSPR